MTHTYSRLFVICAAVILLICAAITPLSPNSDGHEMSVYIIITCLNIQVMRLKKVITNDKAS